MSTHIKNDAYFAKTVLMPGDPLRAKYIAEHFLHDYKEVSNVRGILAYTGKTDEGKEISVMASGMGIPSIGIYSYELFNEYNVENIIRIGTCGGYHEDVKVRDLVIAMSACTDSNLNLTRFQGRTYAPTANFELLKKAYDIAVEKGINPKVGTIYSSDIFYWDDNEDWKKWAAF